jgi:N-acetylmuramoyl-L-alanine amidase
MKKLNLILRLTTLASVIFPSLMSSNISVQASTPEQQAIVFEEQAIQQNNVVAIARPYGKNNKYDLLIIEQIPDKQACWTESGSNPILVKPLLLEFNFEGSCRRATDSNGYSMRINGVDLGMDYLLRLVPRNDELVLVGTSRVGNHQEIVIGSTRGLAAGFMKIILNPQWQVSKRSYQGKMLGHFYLSTSVEAIPGEEEETDIPKIIQTFQ